MEIKVKKTTYEVDGCIEPCFEVSNDYSLIRIAPFYHYFGRTTILITEYLAGEFNSRDEWGREFNELDEYDAMEIAKEYSVYI